MIDLPILHLDCKHFLGDRPCFANKQYKVLCDDCAYYENDGGVAGELPVVKPFAQLKNVTRILIIKLDAAGDVLRTTSILPTLAKKYPRADIDWITKENSKEMLSYAGYINILLTDYDKLNLRDYDIAINLDSGKESCEIMNRVNAQSKLGYGLVNGKPYPLTKEANEWYLMGIDDKTKKLNNKSYHKIIHDICGLQYRDSKPFLRTRDNDIKSLSNRFKEDLEYYNYTEFLLVSLGGGNRWENKKWTKEGYSGLVNKVSSENKDILTGIIGGGEDRSFYNDVCNQIKKRGNIKFLGCDNSIVEFISLINISDKVLTSDSLAMHIATSLGRFVVVLVGPTSSTELDVFGNGEVLKSRKMDCKCFYSSTCTEKINCMNTISVDDVIKSLKL
jgi:ADP-heptose:LPS heptosyltransferase